MLLARTMRCTAALLLVLLNYTHANPKMDKNILLDGIGLREAIEATDEMVIESSVGVDCLLYVLACVDRLCVA